MKELYDSETSNDFIRSGTKMKLETGHAVLAGNLTMDLFGRLTGLIQNLVR